VLQWQGWTGLVAFMVAEAILQIRIYALYSLSKKVLALMLIPYVVCSACSAWMIASELSSTAVTAVVPAEGSFCLPSHIPRRFFRFWIPMLSFESLLCALALFQGFRTFRSDGSVFSSGRRLVSILIRDSILYFLVIFVTYLTCLLIWAIARRSLIEVPVGFSVSMACVLTNRMVLNVRKMSKGVGKIVQTYDNTSPSFFTPGSLSEFEMEELRTMRAEKIYR